MNHWIRLLLIILLMLPISACHFVPVKMKPGNWILKMVPEDANTMYKQGWVDGCKSGLANMTNTTFRTFWNFVQNPLLRRDPTYYKVWKDTYTFCRHYAYGIIRQGDTRMTLQNKNSGSIWQGPWDNVFTKNMLNMWGPAGAGVPFGKFGSVAGDGFFQSMGGTIDLSNPNAKYINGLNGVLDLNY